MLFLDLNFKQCLENQVQSFTHEHLVGHNAMHFHMRRNSWFLSEVDCMVCSGGTAWHRRNSAGSPSKQPKEWSIICLFTGCEVAALFTWAHSHIRQAFYLRVCWLKHVKCLGLLTQIFVLSHAAPPSNCHNVFLNSVWIFSPVCPVYILWWTFCLSSNEAP